MQDVLDFTVTRLGMSLGRKGYTSDMARFLDDLDFNVILNRPMSELGQSIAIQMISGPIILRASYRDINLISVILNRAIELSTKSDFTGNSSTRELQTTAPRQSNEIEHQAPNTVAPQRKIPTSSPRSPIKEKVKTIYLYYFYSKPLSDLAASGKLRAIRTCLNR